jgi:hypothetical protein
MSPYERIELLEAIRAQVRVGFEVGFGRGAAFGIFWDG